MLIKSLNTGTILEHTPGQEITFTLDNPIFEDDRLPVAVSTGIEFPPTPTNKAEFGFVEAMMLAPTVQEIPVAILLAGIEIFIGIIQFDEFSDTTLKYTFVGKAPTGSMDGKIHEIKCENYEGEGLFSLSILARYNALPDWGMPMIVRKENVAKFEYWNGNTEPQCSAIDKYANWLCVNVPFVIPAVRVNYLLNKIYSDLSFPDSIAEYIDHLAILGTYKPEAWRNEQYGLPLTFGEYSEGHLTNFNVADSLPDMKKTDFLSNILKMFCATIFSDGDKYTIHLNKDILNNTNFIDWTDKVAEVYSIVSGQSSKYSIKYANTEIQTFNPSKQDKFDEEIGEAESIPTCSTYEEMLSIFKNSNTYVNARIKDTGHIYSGKSMTANLHPDIIIPMMDMVYQAGAEEEAIGNNSEGNDNYEISIDFSCPRTIPANVTYTKPIALVDPILLQGVSPVIDLPAMDNNRSSEVFIGLLFEHNFIDQGNYYSLLWPYSSPAEERENTLSIAIGGQNGLFARFHQPFGQWYAKKKETIKADVFLTPTDVAGLRLWQKIMIYNRLFFIKTIEITISDKTDIMLANAELIEV
ncbi:MAG: hypothetical protein V8Q54_07200 [Alistipes senegalensis]